MLAKRFAPRFTARVITAWSVAVVTMIGASFVLHKTLAGDAAAGSLPVWALALAAVWAVGGITVCAFAPKYVSSVAPLRGLTPRRVTAICAAALAVVSFVGAWVFLALPPTREAVLANVHSATSASTLAVVGVALLAGAAEECFFRLGLAALTSGWVRWVLPNALYLCVTAASGNLVLTLAAPLVGLAATAAREFSGHWSAPIVVHGVWTLVMVWIFPLTVHAFL